MYRTLQFQPFSSFLCPPCLLVLNQQSTKQMEEEMPTATATTVSAERTSVHLRGVEHELHMLVDEYINGGDILRGHLEELPDLRVLKVDKSSSSRDAPLDLNHDQLQLIRDAAWNASQFKFGICSNSSFCCSMIELVKTQEMKAFATQYIQAFRENARSSTEASMSVHRWASEWEAIKLRPNLDE